MSVITLFATWELYRLFGGKGVSALLPFGLLASGSFLVLVYRGIPAEILLFILCFFLIVLFSLVVNRGPSPFARAAGSLFILFYASGLPSFLLLLREMPKTVLASASYAEGSSFVFLLFVMVWGSDTGAYTVGRLLGRTPLAPSISPKKTVEGALGGLLFAIAGACIARATFMPRMGLADAVLLGLITGGIAQAGDLIESIFKREMNVKDSAGLIPGHGGVLDRFDSLFFAAPFVYFYLRFLILRGV